ncbi:MAG: PAS domain S-box protein, partial [Marinilabiliales bacterium]|nr:PAS domain S-box protein [Marinilabiliales bacterium]
MTDELDDYRRQVEALRKENVYLRKSFERNIRLHELFQEMLRLSDKEQIYFFIADNLARLFPKSIILFNSIDEPRNISKLEVIRGIGDSLFKKILDVLRFNPVGKEYPLVQNHHDYCRTGKLVEFKNGLEEFSASELSPFIARTVEVMLNIHKIYTVGLMRENQLHATIHIFTRSDAVIDDIEFVEMFVQQSGILLQKMMAETELRESELRFKALHNASFGGIAIHEMGRIYDCNQGMADMTGYSLDELIGMDGMLLLTEPSRKIVMDNILSGYEKPYEAMGLRKNGETYHLQLEGRNIPYKGRMMRSVEFRDITRQKELELALQQQKSFFEQMFVQSNTSTQILDPEGWCVRINARLGELFGVQPEAMEGRKYNIFQDGEVQRQGIDEKLRRLIREKKAQSWEVNFDIGEASESQQIEIKERKKAWFSNTAYPILGVDGELMNIIIQHDDITTRKLAEEKIRKSEEQLRIISENAADVIWEMDPEAGRFTYVSPSVFALRGYTAEEVMNMPVSASLTPESNEYINVSMRTSVPEFLSSGKESFTHLHEVDQPRKDGTIVQTEVTTTLMLSPEGRLKIIGISRDITKRKEAERKFRESEERFRKAFLTSPDAFNINRLEDGLYVNINRGFTNITGYTEEDAIGKTSAEVNIWVDFNDRKKLVEGLKKEGVYINLAAKFRKKDGTIATGLMSASVIDLNGVPHILSMTRDISELRRIQDALQENEALFRRIFQEGLISMVICDEKFRFTRVNDAYCRMLGYSEKELLQLSFPEVTHPDHLKEDMGFAEKMRNGEIATYHTEKRYLHRSGAIIWGSSNISVMRDAEGKFLYFLAMVDNVTEKKKLIDELIHAKEKAEESER